MSSDWGTEGWNKDKQKWQNCSILLVRQKKKLECMEGEWLQIHFVPTPWKTLPTGCLLALCLSGHTNKNIHFWCIWKLCPALGSDLTSLRTAAFCNPLPSSEEPTHSLHSFVFWGMLFTHPQMHRLLSQWHTSWCHWSIQKEDALFVEVKDTHLLPSAQAYFGNAPTVWGPSYSRALRTEVLFLGELQIQW